MTHQEETQKEKMTHQEEAQGQKIAHEDRVVDLEIGAHNPLSEDYGSKKEDKREKEETAQKARKKYVILSIFVIFVVALVGCVVLCNAKEEQSGVGFFLDLGAMIFSSCSQREDKGWVPRPCSGYAPEFSFRSGRRASSM